MMSSTEKGQKFKREEWIDPYQEVQGVLLSDYILRYIDKVNLLEQYDEESLKPAGYGLRMGGPCFNGDNPKGNPKFEVIAEKEVTWKDAAKYFGSKKLSTLVIPPNSIIFVSTIEKLNMPRYIIGRFNLKIDLIYQGLLLGTGPQVDPGFKGHLSCPLHNISKEEIRIEYGETFATIDFIKTTPLVDEVGKLSDEELINYSKGEQRELKIGDNRYVLFPKDKIARQNLYDYLPKGKSVASSLANLAVKYEKLNKTVKRNVAVGYVTFLIVFIGVAGLVFQAVSMFNSNDKEWHNVIKRVEMIEIKVEEVESNFDNVTSKDKSQQSTSEEGNKVLNPEPLIDIQK